MFITNFCPNLWLNMSTTIKYLPFVRKLHSFNRIFKKNHFFSVLKFDTFPSLYFFRFQWHHTNRKLKKKQSKTTGILHQLYKWYEPWKIVHDKLSDIQMEWMLGFPIINLCKKLLFLWFSLDIKRAVYDRRNLRNCHDMILIFNVLTDMYVYIYKENQTKNWLKWYDWTWTFWFCFQIYILSMYWTIFTCPVITTLQHIYFQL